MWQHLAVRHVARCVGMDVRAKTFPVTAVINVEVMGDHKPKARCELLQIKLASYLVLCEVTPQPLHCAQFGADGKKREKEDENFGVEGTWGEGGD